MTEYESNKQSLYSCRIATPEDKDHILRMCLDFFSVTQYAKMDYVDPTRVEQVIDHYLSSPLNEAVVVLMEHEGLPVGIIAMIASKSLFNHDLMAVEQIWWVDPPHRKAKNSLALLKLVNDWALKVGCTSVALSGLNSSTDVSKLYEHLGFVQTEYAYYKKVK